jgi:transcriptional regulator with XRE-family HTH domain
MKENFAKKFKELRLQKGVPQSEVANAIGVDATFIGHIETGTKFVSVETLAVIADYFGVTTDYLLGRADK